MAESTKEKAHTIELREIQMQLIKETVEKTPYLGVYSDEISDIRKKMTVGVPTPPA